MPKTINLEKELIGKALTQENVKIGLRVEASKNWTYGNQGDYGVGTVTGIIDALEEYGLDFNFVTVAWDNDDVNNYPLNEECLVISDGKVKKTAVSKFLEKAKLWDVFKIAKVENPRGDLVVGKLFQIIEVKTKQFLIQFAAEEGLPANELWIDSPLLESLTLRKQSKVEDKTLSIINSFAEYVETPKTPKEVIVEHIKKKYAKDVREFLYVHNSSLHYDIINRVHETSRRIGFKAEGAVTMDSILGKQLYFERCDGFFFHIGNTTVRNYVQKNVDYEIKKTYKEWVKIIEQINNQTLFTDALKKVILQSNCNEKLKKFFSEGLGKTDENFIDFDRASKKIQYTPKGKEVQLDGRGNPTGIRQSMSPHKFFGKYFKNFEGISEYEVKCFADEVISTFGEYRMMEIEDGKIGDFYNNLKTVTSCMTGKNMNLFGLYNDNPQVFKMFAITLNGEVVGRALRVNAFAADTHEPFTYFDRLYVANGHQEVIQWFNSYCVNNKITRKNENGAACLDVFYNKELGGKFSKRIYVPIPSVKNDFEHTYKLLPYLDTLRYGMHGVLTNRPDKLTIEGKFKEVPYRYVFDRAGSEYGNKNCRGYCALQGSWVGGDVVKITHAEGKYEKFIGCTVESHYATKTETGYTIK